jgi:hypothetical protein
MVDGAMREDIQYYHRISVITIVYVEDAYWPVADRSVVVVKTVRRQGLTRVAVHRDKACSPKTPIRHTDAILYSLKDQRCEIDGSAGKTVDLS